MATNIPPHNLREVAAAVMAMIDNPDLTPEQIHQLVKGPDFPTGAFIYGRSGHQGLHRDGARQGRDARSCRGGGEGEFQ
jgi:DNA gyrase subunit A